MKYEKWKKMEDRKGCADGKSWKVQISLKASRRQSNKGKRTT